MTDREMLELAAKAAGLEIIYHLQKERDEIGFGDSGLWTNAAGSCWNPISNDGDALRLAVKLGLCIEPYPIYNDTERHSVLVTQRRRTDLLRERNPTEVAAIYSDDPFAATRRAITRAAAEIGMEMA